MGLATTDPLSLRSREMDGQCIDEIVVTSLRSLPLLSQQQRTTMYVGFYGRPERINRVVWTELIGLDDQRYPQVHVPSKQLLAPNRGIVLGIRRWRVRR